MTVAEITGSLSTETDLRDATRLNSNKRPQAVFQGQTPQHEKFVLTLAQAKAMVAKDAKSKAVLHPYLIGRDLAKTGAPSRFIIDIAETDAMIAAAATPAAYDHIKQVVVPDREESVRKEARRYKELLAEDPNARLLWERRDFMGKWWHLWRRRQDMLGAISGLDRYIVLSRVAVWTRPSIYAFVAPDIHPGDALTVFALDDDYSFGILNSSFHRAYFEERCSKMRVDLRYTSRTVFDTYPWPQAPTEDSVGGIVDVVERLINLRDERLADGISLEEQYKSLRDPGRNALRDLQSELDAAVADAYGFSSDDDVLAQLLALNQSIAAQEKSGLTEPRRPGNEGLAGTKRTTSRIEAPVRL